MLRLLLVIALLTTSSVICKRRRPLGLNLPCPEDAVVDANLRNGRLVNHVMSCVTDQGPCNDDFSRRMKRLAPEVFRGHCPKPCNRCTKKQVNKLMAFMANRHPDKFNLMIQKYGDVNTRG